MLKLSFSSKVMEMEYYGSSAMTETKLKEVSREEQKELPKAGGDGMKKLQVRGLLQNILSSNVPDLMVAISKAGTLRLNSFLKLIKRGYKIR